MVSWAVWEEDAASQCQMSPIAPHLLQFSHRFLLVQREVPSVYASNTAAPAPLYTDHPHIALCPQHQWHLLHLVMPLAILTDPMSQVGHWPQLSRSRGKPFSSGQFNSVLSCFGPGDVTLPKGTQVVLRGLQGRAQLNGQSGEVPHPCNVLK